MTFVNRVFNHSCEAMPEIPDGTIHTCVTSPPYYGLRDYGIEGQIGREQTVAEYIDKLVYVFREVRRVLRDDGTVWVNMGDRYVDGHLLGAPWAMAFALKQDGWILRSDCIWRKTMFQPESVKNRPTRTHEYMFLFTKALKYYYDADSIREPLSEQTEAWEKWRASRRGASWDSNNVGSSNPLGANKRSVWTVAPSPNPHGGHIAPFPPDLIRPCIMAGSPPQGIVLDPFMGSGTTARVALEHGRNYVGYELNPLYCNVIRERLGLFGEGVA